MVAEPAAAMALMTAQLNQLDTKLGTFEATVNARLSGLEDLTSKYGEKMLAMGDVLDRSGLHGKAIQELQEGDVTTHNMIQEMKDTLEAVSGTIEAEKRELLKNPGRRIPETPRRARSGGPTSTRRIRPGQVDAPGPVRSDERRIPERQGSCGAD